jgi:hypothetical protein
MDVRTLYQRFKADGVEMETGIFNNGRGSRFFCRAPGGVMFELNTRADASQEYLAPSAIELEAGTRVGAGGGARVPPLQRERLVDQSGTATASRDSPLD